MNNGADKATGLYDVKRLASRMRVKPATIRSMKSRGTIPEPACNDINGGAVWYQEVIEDFLSIKHNDVLVTTINEDLPNIIDLFAGCGGMSLGFSESGFNVVAGFDNWPVAVNTYNKNLNHHAYNLDLSNVEQTIEALKPFFEKDTPGIIGGPPCQDFSSAGKRKEGKRANLTEKFAQIVSFFKPPFFIMENVTRVEKAAAFQRAKAIFSNAGYFVDYIVLNAAFCGVPQSRKRLITFGSPSIETTNRVIEALRKNLSQKATTVRDWFGDSLNTEFYYRHPRSYARRGIFSIDEPSPTIRGVNRPIPAGYPGHPGDAAPISQARPLTTAERAEIQTFPPEFEFVGSKTDIEQMIGNAVPVRLAKYMGDHIASILLESPS
ncbi:DNA cytosine methyltransferase [Kallipyga gabonensis]|uniref:DNA cytosine methyltransferase n=1 Tax=Kallipyga gabonensis TaxID=1686287 RepID=UPI00093A6387|nr:DNA cytosine methyltransferase [Kallipyga gabonensis]